MIEAFNLTFSETGYDSLRCHKHIVLGSRVCGDILKPQKSPAFRTLLFANVVSSGYHTAQQLIVVVNVGQCDLIMRDESGVSSLVE